MTNSRLRVLLVKKTGRSSWSSWLASYVYRLREITRARPCIDRNEQYPRVYALVDHRPRLEPRVYTWVIGTGKQAPRMPSSRLVPVVTDANN